MLRRVEFRNFKALRNVDIDLERLTVFVGPNSSGKTSILEGIKGLCALARQGDFDIFTGPLAPGMIHSWNATEPLELVGISEEGAIRYRISPTPLAKRLTTDDTGWQHAGDFRRFDNAANTADWTQLDGNTRRSASFIPEARLLRLEPSELSKPTYDEELRTNGYGLATYLCDLALSDRDKFDEIVTSARAIIPSLQNVRIRRLPVGKLESAGNFSKTNFKGEEVVLDLIGAEEIPLSLVSEGTVLALGMVAHLSRAHRPAVLLIDDLDRALHPRAQRSLVEYLRRIQSWDPELQIIATSHSPYLLDSLEWKHVRLTTLGDDGSVCCGRFEDHPDFERWKDEMTPGEFWSWAGEDWVAAAKSASHAP